MVQKNRNKIQKVKDNLKEQFQVSEEIISLGFPINPKLKNTLFPNNYMYTNNIILEEKVDELKGSVLELHFQTIQDFTDLYEDEKNDLKEYVDYYRQKNYRFMIHHPFLVQKGKKYFDMDYCWLTVPGKYNENNLYISKMGGTKNYIKEMDIDVTKKFLHFCDFLGIKNLTIHATKPGIIFDSSDFKNFKLKIKELVNYINNKYLNVEIAVETGGITPRQLVDLHKKYNININLDTAHLLLDFQILYPNLSFHKLNEMVIDFFKKHHKFISQLHLNQTVVGDQHLPINENGIVSCNKDILRLINKFHNEEKKDFLVMIESQISDKDKEFVNEALSRIEYFGYGNAVVNIIMGWPLAGKTTGSSILSKIIGEVQSSDDIRIFYKSAMSQDHVVPEKEKDRVYNELLDGLSLLLKKGNPNSNIEATFTLKSRRDRLFKILCKHLLKDVYIWNFIRNEGDSKKRIEIRAGMKKETEKKGEKFPENILADYSIYKKFMNNNSLEEKPSLFSIDEIPNEIAGQVHVMTYDTSSQEMTLLNPDKALEKGAALLSKHAKSLGFGKIKIIHLDNKKSDN